jgi:putative transposase
MPINIYLKKRRRVYGSPQRQSLPIGVLHWQHQSTVMVDSDQGDYLSSYDWRAFLKARNLQPSLSRSGNCHDNAVAESFSSCLKESTYAARPSQPPRS